MHGVIAAELIAWDSPRNPDILDGEDGIIRMIGLGGRGSAESGAGPRNWEMATRGSTMRLHASCGAGHWGRTAIGGSSESRPMIPTRSSPIDRVAARLPEQS